VRDYESTELILALLRAKMAAKKLRSLQELPPVPNGHFMRAACTVMLAVGGILQLHGAVYNVIADRPSGGLHIRGIVQSRRAKSLKSTPGSFCRRL